MAVETAPQLAPPAPAVPEGPANRVDVRPAVTVARTEPTVSDSSASGRLEITGLDASYGSFRALRTVDLSIRPHAVTALIGPSGCGKSTFLRTLNRMHELVPGATVKGSIELDGVDAPVLLALAAYVGDTVWSLTTRSASPARACAMIRSMNV